MPATPQDERLCECEATGAGAKLTVCSTASSTFPNPANPADDNVSTQALVPATEKVGADPLSKGMITKSFIASSSSNNHINKKSTNNNVYPVPLESSSMAPAPVPLATYNSSLFRSTPDDEDFVQELLGKGTVNPMKTSTTGDIYNVTPSHSKVSCKTTNCHKGGNHSTVGEGMSGMKHTNEDGALHAVIATSMARVSSSLDVISRGVDIGHGDDLGSQQQQGLEQESVAAHSPQALHSSSSAGRSADVEEGDIAAPTSLPTASVQRTSSSESASVSPPVNPIAGLAIFPDTRRVGIASGLVEAHVVSEDDLGVLVEGKPIQESQCRKLWLFALVVILAVIFIIGMSLGVALSKSPSNENGEGSLTAPTLVPNLGTLVPSIAPNVTEVVIAFQNRLPNQTVSAIENNMSSPQYKAYQWVTSDNQAPLVGYDPVMRLTYRFALATLYFATGGADTTSSAGGASSSCWTHTPSWMNHSLHECEWEGIYCSSSAQGQGKRILKLEVSDNNLKGTLPPEIGLLAGIEEMDLMMNQLTGKIPTTIGWLSSLTSLSLSDAQLSGPIPTELMLLTNLTGLRLSLNRFSGTLPADLGLLTNLVEFTAARNDLFGSIPADIGRLTRLGNLDLSSQADGPNTGLNGPIPTGLWTLSSLSMLTLFSNALSGTISTEIGRLANLQELYLGRNALTGTIPTTLGQLAKLRHADFYDNQLSGSVPTEVCKLLNYLDLQVDWDKVACGCC